MAISTDSALPENRVKISEDLRNLEVPVNEQVLGCVGDAWVRRVWFDMPRYCDGTDLSTYTLSVNYRNTDEDEDRYTVNDAVVNADTITFSWLVGAVACAAPGLTSVSIKAQKLNGDIVEKEFNSTIYYFKVLPANTTGAEPLQEYSDAFTTLMLQWQAEVDEAVAEAPKGKLIGTVDTAQTVTDAYPTTMHGATVYGKSVQDGTPTPDNPVPVQVVSGTVNITVNETVTPIDLQGHTLASVPSGRMDILNIDAAGIKSITANTIMLVFDGSDDENWTMENNGRRVTTPAIPNIVSTPTSGTIANIYSNYATANTATNTWNGRVGVSIQARKVQVADGSNAMTVSGWRAQLAANPMVVIVGAITPQTIELGTITPPNIASGDTLAIYASLDPEWAIEYEQDPNIVVTALQSSIAPVEGSTASTNYAVNSYLIHGNQLYRVTSAIATGEAITPGTNCVACTVMGELVRLTA